MLDKQNLTDQEKAEMDAGVKFGMDMLRQLPRGNLDAMEGHITGVLIVFWGAERARMFAEWLARNPPKAENAQRHLRRLGVTGIGAG